MEKFKRFLSIFSRVFISVLILFFLFRQVDQKNIADTIRESNKSLLMLAFVVFFFGNLLCLFRWHLLLKAIDINLPLKRTVISFAGGIFFNLFLPSTIGGDLVRSIDLSTHTKRPKEVIATVFLDRLSGYIGLVILALISLAFGWELIQDSSVLIAIGIISAILIAVMLVLFNTFLYNKINQFLDRPNSGKIRDLIRSLHEEIHVFRNKKGVAFVNLFISFLIQAASPLTFYLIALSLNLKVHYSYFFVLVPVINAITLLPISFGGLGLRDATTIYFFAKAGVLKDTAFAMSLINFSFILMYGIIGGLVYVLTVRHRRMQHHSSSGVSCN